jgi:hypothetical protein
VDDDEVWQTPEMAWSVPPVRQFSLAAARQLVSRLEARAMTRLKLEESKIEQIRVLASEGKGPTEIAKIAGCSRSSVSRVVERANGKANGAATDSLAAVQQQLDAHWQALTVVRKLEVLLPSLLSATPASAERDPRQRRFKYPLPARPP